jgi:tight adherence protein B
VNPLILLAAIAGALMVFGATLALLAGNRSQVGQRMEQYVQTAGGALAVEPDMPRRRPVGDRLDRAVAGRGFSHSIKARIARADAKLRVSEYIALQIICAVLFGGLAFLIFDGSFILSGVGAVVGLLVPRIYLAFAAARRLRAFERQLVDTLNLWVNALRSGYSVLQSMEAVAMELPPPISVEFERVVQEVRLGLSVPQALENVLRRMPSEDFDLVVTAVNIQREVGGNLAEVLDTISFTIRERIRIKGEIRTLTAQGRLSAWIISLLPIALALILLAINEEYMSQLWITEAPMILSVIPCGWLLMAIGLIMMGVGIYIIQRIVDIEV